MAQFNLFFDKLMLEEGGFVDNPNDHGGATKYGITLREWLAKGHDENGDGQINVEDLKLITKEDAYPIAKAAYWDKVWGDKIVSQSIAEFLMDWAYMSGVGTAVKKLQDVLKLSADGVMGPNTLNAANSQSPIILFNLLKNRRARFFNDIVVNNPSQRIFLSGWLSRNDHFTFRA